ncbi:MAG: amidohydrolase family protein [Promicromonosporaceae bacterium]|nr:amidohydrolase family protein [Promicromonosporaceae bacterium]
MSSILYRGGRIHAASDPGAQALLVDGGAVAWIGTNDTADGLAARADRVIELDGALVAPGFVDAHFHALATGQALGAPDRLSAYRAALGQAAAQGIVAVHEFSNPATDTREGLSELMGVSVYEHFPQVLAYRGELLTSTAAGLELKEALPFLAGFSGARVDGSMSEGAAAMRQPYLNVAQVPGLTYDDQYGRLELTAEQIATHLAASQTAGLPGGLHVEGDRAMDEFLAGLSLAADMLGGAELGAKNLRSGQHRIEHALFVDAVAMATLLLYGVSLSIQPASTAASSNSGGAWAKGLGVARMANVGPIADVTGAGVRIALGSGSPGAPLDPWLAIRAAVEHPDESQRLSSLASFRAHTVGGWQIAGFADEGAGELAVGNPAHLAVWRAENYGVYDPTRPLWAGEPEDLPLLPDMTPGSAPPECLHTLRAGVPIHDTFS